MRLLFINPLVGFDFFNGSLKTNLGILYLASVSMKMGHTVFVKNVSKFEYPSILKKIKPDIVLITCATTQQKSAIKIMFYTKKYNPKIITIIGGYFPTFGYKVLLKKYPNIIDFIIIGEGEKTLELLLKKIEIKEKMYNNIKGIAFFNNNKIFFTGKAPLIKNLDKLPFPARFLMKREVNDIISSRGCNMNCKFCSIRSFYGNIIRLRSIENFIEEVSLMYKSGNKKIDIADDNFLLNLKRLNKFKNLLKKKKIKTKFSVMLRIDSIDYKKIKILKSLNFKRVYFGLQSVDEEVLRFFETGFNYRKIEEFFKLLKKIEKLNIEIGLFYIINSGLPKEDMIRIKRNMNYLLGLLKEKKIKNVKVIPYILIPNRGSNIYSFFKRKGYFKGRLDNILDNWPKYEYNGINEEILDKYYNEFTNKLSKKKMLFYDSTFPNLRNLRFIKYLMSSSFGFKVKLMIVYDIILNLLKMKNPKYIKNVIKNKYF